MYHHGNIKNFQKYKTKIIYLIKYWYVQIVKKNTHFLVRNKHCSSFSKNKIKSVVDNAYSIKL